MKRVLIVHNSTNDHELAMVQAVLNQPIYAECSQMWICGSSEQAAWLEQRGIHSLLLQSNRPQGKSLPPKLREPMAKESLFSNLSIPDSSLEMWKVLFFDRFVQFINYEDQRCEHFLIGAVINHYLIASLNLFDHHSQIALRFAKARGIPTTVVQTGFLRTKEALSLPVTADTIVVKSESDRRFVQECWNIGSDRCAVLPDPQTTRLTTLVRGQRPAIRSSLRQEFGLSPSALLGTISFSLRHLWELRAFFKRITELRGESSPTASAIQFLVLCESPRDQAEWPVLFSQEIEHLSLTLIPYSDRNFDYHLAADFALFFQMEETAELTAQAGISTVLFDPFDFNETSKTICGTAVHAIRDRSFTESALRECLS